MSKTLKRLVILPVYLLAWPLGVLFTLCDWYIDWRKERLGVPDGYEVPLRWFEKAAMFPIIWTFFMLVGLGEKHALWVQKG